MTGDTDKTDPCPDPQGCFERFCVGACLMLLLLFFLFTLVSLGGGCCSYRGGTVVDGTNLAVGMKLPGTEWSVNVLDYVGGVRVAGNEQTSITVMNEVAETNRYFGVIETMRHTRLSAEIAPVETVDERHLYKDKAQGSDDLPH